MKVVIILIVNEVEKKWTNVRYLGHRISGCWWLIGCMNLRKGIQKMNLRSLTGTSILMMITFVNRVYEHWMWKEERGDLEHRRDMCLGAYVWNCLGNIYNIKKETFFKCISKINWILHRQALKSFVLSF